MKLPVRKEVRTALAVLGVLALAFAILAPFGHHHGPADEHVSCPVCQLASHHHATLTEFVAVPASYAGVTPVAVPAARAGGFPPLFALPDPRSPPLV